MTRSIISLMQAVAKNKKIELTKDGWERVVQIEREVKSRKLKPESAVERMKQEGELKSVLDEADWKNIKEQIEDIID